MSEQRNPFLVFVFAVLMSAAAQEYCDVNNEDCDCTKDCCCPGYIPNRDNYTTNPLFVIIIFEGNNSVDTLNDIDKALEGVNVGHKIDCSAKRTIFSSNLSSRAVQDAYDNKAFRVYPYVNDGNKVESTTSTADWVQMINQVERLGDKMKWDVFRAPFFSWNDNLFDALHHVNTNDGFSISIDFSYKTKRPLFPFLLSDLTPLCREDEAVLKGATPICPGRYVGQWILPNNAFYTEKGSDCYTLAECQETLRSENSTETVLDLLFRNFEWRSQEHSHHRFDGFWQSRQPITVAITEDFFTLHPRGRSQAINDLHTFFSNVSQHHFAYFVHPHMVMEWMENQYSVSDLRRVYYGKHWLEGDCVSNSELEKDLSIALSVLLALSLVFLIFLPVIPSKWCTRCFEWYSKLKKRCKECFSRGKQPNIDNKRKCGEFIDIPSHEVFKRQQWFLTRLFLPFPFLCSCRKNVKRSWYCTFGVLVGLIFPIGLFFTLPILPLGFVWDQYRNTDIGRELTRHQNEMGALALTISIGTALSAQLLLNSIWYQRSVIPALEELKNLPTAKAFPVSDKVQCAEGADGETTELLASSDTRTYAATAEVSSAPDSDIPVVESEEAADDKNIPAREASSVQEGRESADVGDDKNASLPYKLNRGTAILSLVFTSLTAAILLVSTLMTCVTSKYLRGWAWGPYDNRSVGLQYSVTVYTGTTAAFFVNFVSLLSYHASVWNFWIEKDDNGKNIKILKKIAESFKDNVMAKFPMSIFFGHVVINTVVLGVFSYYLSYDLYYLDYPRRTHVLLLYVLVILHNLAMLPFFYFSNYITKPVESKAESKIQFPNPQDSKLLRAFFGTIPFILSHTVVPLVLVLKSLDR